MASPQSQCLAFSIIIISTLVFLADANPPSGFTSSYVGTVYQGLNLIGIRFLPNGYALFIDRNGIVSIGDLYSPNIPRNTYIDLSSVTFSDQYGYAEVGLWDIAQDPNLSTNRKFYQSDDKKWCRWEPWMGATQA